MIQYNHIVLLLHDNKIVVNSTKTLLTVYQKLFWEGLVLTAENLGPI